MAFGELQEGRMYAEVRETITGMVEHRSKRSEH